MRSASLSMNQVGQIRNDGAAAAAQVRIDVVYLGSQGQLLGTAYSFVDDLPPVQTASFTGSTFNAIQKATDIET
jgi:hypothetical protein